MSSAEEVFRLNSRIRELEQENSLLKDRLEMLPNDSLNFLTQRQQAIIEYVNNRPERNKQSVINELSEKGLGSRVTILKDIKKLEDYGIIVARKANKNTSTYSLYINNNYIKDLIDIHEDFEKSFIELAEKLKSKIFDDDLFKIQPIPNQNTLKVVHEILLIYVHFIAMNMLHAIFNWPEMIRDHDKLIKLNAILFANLQKLHASVSNSLTYKSEKNQVELGIPVEQNTILHWFKLNPFWLESSIESAKKYNVLPEMEKVLDICWRVSSNFLNFARPLFEKDGHRPGHNIQRWNKQTWRPKSWKEALKYHEKGFLESELNVLLNKAGELGDSGKPEEALKYIGRVLSFDPENIRALNDKGYLLNNQRRYEEASIYLDKALSIAPNYVNSLVNKGISLACSNKKKESINYFDRALEIEPNNFNALNNKGFVLLQLNDFLNAREFLDSAFKIDPDNPLILLNNGLFFEGKRDYPEALRWFEKLLNIKPDHLDALVGKGRILCEVDKENEAIPIFEKALDIDPDNTDALNNKGVYLLKHSEKVKDFEEALRCFDKVLEINPVHAQALNNKAGCIIRFKKGNEDFEEALRCFDKVLEINPNDFEIILNKGILLTLWKKYGQSIKNFDIVLHKYPNHKDALLFKAEALLEWRNHHQALKYFDRVLSLDPNNMRAKDGKRKASAPDEGV
jgi:tetratricopeptide (TPR) repeat protein